MAAVSASAKDLRSTTPFSNGSRERKIRPVSRRFLARIAPLWVACVIGGSLIPGEGKKAFGTLTPRDQAASGHLRWQHRAAHFVVFGSTALLFITIAEKRAGQLLACFATIALGCAIEQAQDLVYKQGLEWWDIRDDSIAAFVVYAGVLAAPRVPFPRK